MNPQSFPQVPFQVTMFRRKPHCCRRRRRVLRCPAGFRVARGGAALAGGARCGHRLETEGVCHNLCLLIAFPLKHPSNDLQYTSWSTVKRHGFICVYTNHKRNDSKNHWAGILCAWWQTSHVWLRNSQLHLYRPLGDHSFFGVTCKYSPSADLVASCWKTAALIALIIPKKNGTCENLCILWDHDMSTRNALDFKTNSKRKATQLYAKLPLFAAPFTGFRLGPGEKASYFCWSCQALVTASFPFLAKPFDTRNWSIFKNPQRSTMPRLDDAGVDLSWKDSLRSKLAHNTELQTARPVQILRQERDSKKFIANI